MNSLLKNVMATHFSIKVTNAAESVMPTRGKVLPNWSHAPDALPEVKEGSTDRICDGANSLSMLVGGIPNFAGPLLFPSLRVVSPCLSDLCKHGDH